MIRKWAVLVACAVALATGGCVNRGAAPAATQAEAPGTERETLTAADVVQALTEAGFDAALTDTALGAGGPFGAPGSIIRLGEESVNVYVYPSVRDSAYVRASRDATSVQRAGQSWSIDPLYPSHLIRRKNIIVVYATPDEEKAARVRAVIAGMN